QHLSLLHTAKTLVNHDRPQTLVLSYIYELPLGPGKRFLNTNNPVAKHLVGGWQVSGVQQYLAGVPLAVATRGVIAPGFGGAWALRNNDVPIRTTAGCNDFDQAYPSGPFQYLNPGAFRTPPSFTFGDTKILPSTRDCLFLNENISIIKNFSVSEGIRARLGVDFYNIFNRHRW